jgi:hypothetical protein
MPRIFLIARPSLACHQGCDEAAATRCRRAGDRILSLFSHS